MGEQLGRHALAFYGAACDFNRSLHRFLVLKLLDLGVDTDDLDQLLRLMLN